jgi:hypothetical protein
LQENAADRLAVKKEPQCENDADVNSLQSENDSVNVKDEHTQYQIPLACVEVHSDSKVIFFL